jgi:hypothetical protein
MMRLAPTSEKVKIKLFVYAGEEKIRHTSSMAGEWGWDFECSCGHTSRTGGAIKGYIEGLIRSHKREDHDYRLVI